MYCLHKRNPGRIYIGSIHERNGSHNIGSLRQGMGCGNSGCSNSTYDTGESFTQIGDLGHLGGWYWLRKMDIDGHWWKLVFKMVDKCSWPPLAQPVDSALGGQYPFKLGEGRLRCHHGHATCAMVATRPGVEDEHLEVGWWFGTMEFYDFPSIAHRIHVCYI